MRFPENYLWGFPGFYSITVPYGKSNDFFFSGHIGCCMIQYCEFGAIGWKKMEKFSLLSLCMQFVLMTATRGHYFIDMISGVVFGHYMWLLAEKYSYLIDVYVFRIPFHKRFPRFSLTCEHCQQPQSNWTNPHSMHEQLSESDSSKHFHSRQGSGVGPNSYLRNSQ